MNVVVNELKSIIMNCLLVGNCFIYNMLIKIFEILIFLNVRICFEMCSMEFMILWVVFNFFNGCICFLLIWIDILVFLFRLRFCDYVILFCEYIYIV